MHNKKFLLKSFLVMVVFAVSVLLFSCEMPQGGGGKAPEAPTNLTIENDILSFDEVSGASKYRIEITNINTNVSMKRYVTSGVDLNTLNINEGEYMIKVQALSKDDKESEYSEEVYYKQKDLYAVKAIDGQDLVDGNYIKWMGRTHYEELTKVNTMYYTAAGFEVKIKKADEDLTYTVTLTSTNYNVTDKQAYMVAVKDGDFENTITYRLTKQTSVLEVVGSDGFSIDDDEVHTIAMYKRNESIDSHVSLKAIETSGKFVSGYTYKERKIEMIAASSSTGYGNLPPATAKTTSNSDGLHAFAFLTAQNLNAEINIVSASGWGISASRWTSPNTINMHDQYKYVDVFSNVLWDTTQYVPDVIITNFGTNDLSYINAAANEADKNARRENFIATYVDFIVNLQNTYPNAQIIILYGLMNESGVYADHEEIYSRAKVLVPSVLMIKINGDAGGYNSHPSLASHKTISDTLTAYIQEQMGW